MGYKDAKTKLAKWREWYHRTKGTEKQTLKRRERRRRLRLAWKAKVTAIKVGRGCQYCGERHPACLDFHHVRDMTIEVSIVTAFATWKEIEREIEKCVVLCANCHLKMHGRRKARPVAPRVRGKYLDEE